MRILIRLLALGALLVLSQKSHALTCTMDGTYLADYYLETTVAISNTMPKGTVVWRSPNRIGTLKCWQEQPAGAELVYLYASPESNLALGEDIEIGINIDGKDYTYSNLTQVKNGIKREPTKLKLDGCRSFAGCKDQAKIMTVSYNFFFSKRSPANTGQAKEGPVSSHSKFAVFQLDGEGGLNPTIGSNYRQYVHNLHNLRYIACSSTIALSQSTINFGSLSNVNAQRDQIARQKPFSITANKNCDSAYGLAALLKPLTDAKLDAQREHVLVPEDNKSVGITLHDMDNNERVVPFNQEFELVPHSQDRTVTRHFAARAVWLTDKANTTLGKFNAGATIDIYYK